MDEKTYPLSVVSTLTGIKKSTLKRLGEQRLIDLRYSHDRLDASKAGYEIHSKIPSMDGRDKITSVMPISQTELTRFLTWLEEHPEIERDLNNDPVIGIDQLMKDAGYTEITIQGMYKNGQINITGLSRNLSKGIISGYVTRLEYERILDLARSQQSKPTYEQLEADIIELKAENERLKNQSSQQENPKTPNLPCMSRIVEIIELFENSNTFIKYGIGTPQGLIEDWLEDKTETRDEKTVIKKLITEHYGITTGRTK